MIQKYIVKKTSVSFNKNNSKIKWYTRKYSTQIKAVMEAMRHIEKKDWR